MAESQVSLISTTPLPQVEEQSGSLADEQPVGQQPSMAAEQEVMGLGTQWMVQSSSLPIRLRGMQPPGSGAQAVGQAPMAPAGDGLVTHLAGLEDAVAADGLAVGIQRAVAARRAAAVAAHELVDGDQPADRLAAGALHDLLLAGAVGRAGAGQAPFIPAAMAESQVSPASTMRFPHTTGQSGRSCSWRRSDSSHPRPGRR
jgi:hypothetical protein